MKLVKRKEAFPLNYHNITPTEKDKSEKEAEIFRVNIPKIQNEKAYFLLYYKQICI
jgi:hypothetical protein